MVRRDIQRSVWSAVCWGIVPRCQKTVRPSSSLGLRDRYTCGHAVLPATPDDEARPEHSRVGHDFAPVRADRGKTFCCRMLGGVLARLIPLQVAMLPTRTSIEVDLPKRRAFYARGPEASKTSRRMRKTSAGRSLIPVLHGTLRDIVKVACWDVAAVCLCCSWQHIVSKRRVDTD